MSFRIEYRTQTLGVPKSLKSPHITRLLGTPGPHIPSDMGLPRPHITRNMGTGVPILGGPHFTQTPVHAELVTTNCVASYLKERTIVITINFRVVEPSPTRSIPGYATGFRYVDLK